MSMQLRKAFASHVGTRHHRRMCLIENIGMGAVGPRRAERKLGQAAQRAAIATPSASEQENQTITGRTRYGMTTMPTRKFTPVGAAGRAIRSRHGGPPAAMTCCEARPYRAGADFCESGTPGGAAPNMYGRKIGSMRTTTTRTTTTRTTRMSWSVTPQGMADRRGLLS